jgi:putative ABC transport system permease protein
MTSLRKIAGRVRGLLDNRAPDPEFEAEMEEHLRLLAERYVRQGMAPEEAAREARRQFGNVTLLVEDRRALQTIPAIEALWSDLVYASRRLRKNPTFTTAAVVTLALGIGANTAIFSVVSPILFESLPYPQAGRVATISDVVDDGSRADVTFGTYRELVERSRSFEGLAVMRSWQPTMTGPAEPERFDGQRVSASYFRVLGVSPVLGRDFEEAEDRLNGPPVAILGDGLWRRRFGGDGAILGRQVTLDDRSYTVVGVMPAAFENVLAPAAEIWTPLQYDLSLPVDGREWGHHLRMVARLRSGVDTSEAGRELDAIARAPVEGFARPAWASLERGLVVNSLQEEVTGAVRPALLAILGAVALVLLIACANVASLLLASGAERREELAVRAALGAGRARLVRQLLAESLLLAVAGGLLGMALAEVGVQALVALAPPGLPRLEAIGVDETAFAFALGTATLVGLLVGLVPALYASRGDLQAGLRRSSRQTAGAHQATRRALVVLEVALAIVLLVSAGLLLRSVERLFAVDPGFDAANVLAMQVQVSGRRFDDDATHRFFGQALEAVRRVPGVDEAAFTSQLPLSGDDDEYGVHFESDPIREEDRSAFRFAVTPGYFEAMGIPLVRGRLLGEQDGAGAPVAVLINESFAERKFPGRDPIGQRLHIGADEGPWATVVGVVGDVKQRSLVTSDADAVYVSTTQWRFADRALWLVARWHGDAPAPVSDVRNAIWSVDKDQPILRISTMEEVVAASAAERRFAMVLFEAFGLLALLLAAIGIYGVLAGSVAERAREIGVRLALGASRGQILALVVRQGMTLTGLGVLIGLTGAAAASHVIVTLLFGVSRLDLPTYLGVIVLLAGASAIACGLPAWRAARVDPATALRAE